MTQKHWIAYGVANAAVRTTRVNQMSTMPPSKSMDIARVILNASVFNFRGARVMEDRLLQAVMDFFDLEAVLG